MKLLQSLQNYKVSKYLSATPFSIKLLLNGSKKIDGITPNCKDNDTHTCIINSQKILTIAIFIKPEVDKTLIEHLKQ